MFLELLDHFHYDRALDGKKDRPSCESVPRGPCYLWYCPPAPPCKPSDEPLPLSREDGPFTVFALTDQSITALLEEWSSGSSNKKISLERALKDKELSKRLEDILKYHIVKKESVTTPKMVVDHDAATFDAVDSSSTDSSSSPGKIFMRANTLRENNRTTGSDLVFFENELVREDEVLWFKLEHLKSFYSFS